MYCNVLYNCLYKHYLYKEVINREVRLEEVCLVDAQPLGAGGHDAQEAGGRLLLLHGLVVTPHHSVVTTLSADRATVCVLSGNILLLT